MDELSKGRHFEREVIVLCVWWYLRFTLSLRDLVEMMAERGLVLARTTIMRWVQRSRSAGIASPAGMKDPKMVVPIHSVNDYGLKSDLLADSVKVILA